MEAVKNKIESLKRAVGEKEDHISDLEHQLKEEKSHNQKFEDEVKALERKNQLLEDDLDRERDRANSSTFKQKEAEQTKDQQAEEMKSLKNQIVSLECEWKLLVACV